MIWDHADEGDGNAEEEVRVNDEGGEEVEDFNEDELAAVEQEHDLMNPDVSADEAEDVKEGESPEEGQENDGRENEENENGDGGENDPNQEDENPEKAPDEGAMQEEEGEEEEDEDADDVEILATSCSYGMQHKRDHLARTRAEIAKLRLQVFLGLKIEIFLCEVHFMFDWLRD